MGNFKVGDSLKFIEDYGSYKKGDKVTLLKHEDDHLIYFKGKNGNGVALKTRFELADKPSKKQRIETLEKEVSELKLIVHELRKRKETPVTLEIDGKKLSTTSVIGKTIEPSTDISVEDKQADVIEFEGQQYRKVEREAVEGDVVIFRENTSEVSSINKPYKVIKEITEPMFVGDIGNSYTVYNHNFNRTPETVDVYELITEPSTTTTVEDKQPAVTVTGPLTAHINEVAVTKSPNQLRAEVIEKAKYFIEYLKKKKHTFKAKVLNSEVVTVENVYLVPSLKNIDDTGLNAVCNLEFVVNADKGVVVALLKGYHTNKLKSKGIAKCMPGDVFNEHIGKAIALGRALGLDVSEFEQAVQPSEAVIGTDVYLVHVKKNITAKQSTIAKVNLQIRGKYAEIINDTNAIYLG